MLILVLVELSPTSTVGEGLYESTVIREQILLLKASVLK